MTGVDVFPPERVVSDVVLTVRTSTGMGTNKAALLFGGMYLMEVRLRAARALDSSRCWAAYTSARKEPARAPRPARCLA